MSEEVKYIDHNQGIWTSEPRLAWWCDSAGRDDEACEGIPDKGILQGMTKWIDSFSDILFG